MLEAGELIALNEAASFFYEAALGRVSWAEPLAQAAKIMNASNAVFSVRDPITRKAHFSFGNFGTDPTFTRNFAETYAFLSPFVIATAISPEGKAVNPINLIGRDDYERGRFYKEWSAPQRYHDYLGSVLLRQPNAIYTIAFGRTTDLPLFNQSDHEKLEILTPHVTRALQISEKLNTFEREKAELLSTIDALTTPIILIDSDRVIRQINSAAIALMEQEKGITNQGGKLRFAEPGVEQEFRSACGVKHGHAAILRAMLKNGMQVHLLAHYVRDSGGSSQIEDERTLVVIDWPKTKTVPIGENVRSRFGLTISELRVLLLLIDGRSITSVATDLGVSQNTIKTHIARMFDKTGTNRQQDLIRTVLDQKIESPVAGKLQLHFES
jgi:DNA-binding CsgD family transcriptional regulator/PAS domain-containing protein